MLISGTKDPNIKSKWLSDGKNSLRNSKSAISKMSKQVFRKKVVMCDEYTDVINNEQLSFCRQTVNKQLFLGYYEIANIQSETIVNGIKGYSCLVDNCGKHTMELVIC